MKISITTKIEQVRQAILLQILSGSFRPGERLIEAKLSQQLGVSQATVNAALQDLHNQGLVTKLLNRSTNVRRYTLKDIEQLFRVRMLLEPGAAASVAISWSKDARECLQQHVDQMRRAARTRDLAKWGLADYAFHQDVYRLSGNPFLIQAGQALAAAPFAYMLCDHAEALPTDYLAMAEDHQEVILAMEAGPDEAERITRDRIGGWLEHSRRAVQPVTVEA